MSAPFEELSTLDRMVHEPARLAILTALSSCETADFVFLQSLTGLTHGNLGNHLTKLKNAGLIEIAKSTIKGKKGRIPQTCVRLTGDGRRTIDEHWKRLEELRKASKRWTTSVRPRLLTEPQTT